jgi:hypothetical protein
VHGVGDGDAQSEVGDLVFPLIVIQPDQRLGRVGAVVEQRGGQLVVIAVDGAVVAGDGGVGGDDAHRHHADE